MEMNWKLVTIVILIIVLVVLFLGPIAKLLTGGKSAVKETVELADFCKKTGKAANDYLRDIGAELLNPSPDFNQVAILAGEYIDCFERKPGFTLTEAQKENLKRFNFDYKFKEDEWFAICVQKKYMEDYSKDGKPPFALMGVDPEWRCQDKDYDGFFSFTQNKLAYGISAYNNEVFTVGESAFFCVRRDYLRRIFEEVRGEIISGGKVEFQNLELRFRSGTLAKYGKPLIIDKAVGNSCANEKYEFIGRIKTPSDDSVTIGYDEKDMLINMLGG